MDKLASILAQGFINKLSKNIHSIFYTVKLTVDENVYERLPYIYGATMKQDQQYEVEQLHFHWGAKNNRGAEHVLNGVR